ncbi:MAG: SDR family NAD(P)-dependent oxidoreductase [Bacteroidetes bacterium]|nr:SDR family NAD(P)-dependent oxidoreductase [Bacteroidota bacterium]
MEISGTSQNKIALITGASSGFGKNLANLLIYEGWIVVGIARRTEKLKEIKEHLGENFHYFKCDVSKSEQIQEITNKLKDKKLLPNLFILNAGQLIYEEDGNLNITQYRKTFDINYFGVIEFINQWLPYCLKNGGTFVGISSLAAKQPLPNLTSYCATKAAIANTFESLRLQYLNSNVKFVTVFPGPMKTDMVKSPKDVFFIVKPSDAADYVLKKIFAGKQLISFPFFYRMLIKIGYILPNFILRKFINFKPSPFEDKDKTKNN